MAANGVGSAQVLDRAELRRALVTSSTKRRISELSGLHHQIEDGCKSYRGVADSRLSSLEAS